MKKVLSFLAIAAVLFCVACKKDNGGKNNNKENNKEEQKDDPKPEKATITIDGDFADWAKLDQSKVAVAECAAEAKWTALKTIKVYANEAYVFVYFKFDKSAITWEVDVEHVPVHLYLNGDGDATTGGFGDQWTDAATDVLFEGFMTNGTDFDSYNPGAFQWTGETNGTGWEWEELLPEGAGVCSGAGKNDEYEIQLIREMYPLGTLADTFSIGVDIQQGWSSVGVLPNTNISDDNPNGLAASLKVVTDK